LQVPFKTTTTLPREIRVRQERKERQKDRRGASASQGRKGSDEETFDWYYKSYVVRIGEERGTNWEAKSLFLHAGNTISEGIREIEACSRVKHD